MQLLCKVIGDWPLRAAGMIGVTCVELALDVQMNSGVKCIAIVIEGVIEVALVLICVA